MYITANELEPNLSNLFNTWKSSAKLFNFLMLGVNKKP